MVYKLLMNCNDSTPLLTNPTAHGKRVEIQRVPASHALAVFHHGRPAQDVSVPVQIGRRAGHRSHTAVRFQVVWTYRCHS